MKEQSFVDNGLSDHEGTIFCRCEMILVIMESRSFVDNGLGDHERTILCRYNVIFVIRTKAVFCRQIISIINVIIFLCILICACKMFLCKILQNIPNLKCTLRHPLKSVH